jgi:opacity protein-like surface antigen
MRKGLLVLALLAASGTIYAQSDDLYNTKMDVEALNAPVKPVQYQQVAVVKHEAAPIPVDQSAPVHKASLSTPRGHYKPISPLLHKPSRAMVQSMPQVTSNPAPVKEVALALPNPWYVGVALGANLMSPNSEKDPNVFELEGGYKPGYNTALRLGYIFHNHLSFELEWGYLNNKLDNAKVDGLSASDVHGNSNITFLMGNVQFYFKNSSNFTPYIGVGGGWAHITHKWDRMLFDSGPYAVLTDTYTGSDFAFAYQAFLGLKYQFATHWSVNVDFKYLSTTPAKFKLKNSQTGDTAKVEQFNNVAMLQLGAAYHFG